LLGGVSRRTHPHLFERLDYYCGIERPFELDASAVRMRDIPLGRRSTYAFDFRRTARYFDRRLRVSYRFGDETDVPVSPTLVKARPVNGDHANSVLMKWNTVRHYYFVERDEPFATKLDRAVWRGSAFRRPMRMQFLERYVGSDVVDCGTNDPRQKDSALYRPYMSIAGQLRHKFVVSIEGNDVATNLKWIMSSNSLCLMPRPRHETWFMEGRLEPGRHYVELRDDMSDLPDAVDHYSEHPREAERIIENAHAWVETFRDEPSERLLSLLVLRRYLRLSGQMDGQ
jgi:hypothetical protein